MERQRGTGVGGLPPCWRSNCAPVEGARLGGMGSLWMGRSQEPGMAKPEWWLCPCRKPGLAQRSGGPSQEP